MKCSTGKVLRILLFVGAFVYCLYSDIRAENVTFLKVFSDLFAASTVYLIATLFGVVLRCTGNYILAFILTAAIAVFAGYKLDDLAAAIPWLNTDLEAQIITVIVTLWILKDVVIAVRAFIPSHSNYKADQISDLSFETEDVLVEPVKTAQQVLKENPEYMLELSKQLEVCRGYKPTYEELIDYIDHEAFHLKSDEEISQEVQELTNSIKRNIKQKYRSQDMHIEKR